MTEYLERNHKVLLLGRCYLFSNLDFEELDHLAEYTGLREAKQNEMIFQKNDTGNEMFFIVKGQVELTTISDEGKAFRFGALGEGDMFGEISLFDNQERTATITATEETQLLVLEQGPFLNFISQYPKTALKLLSAMAARLRYTDQIFEDTVFGPLKNRLAKKLLGLSRVYGTPEGSGVRITIKLSEKELAKMLGTSVENIKRQVSRLENKGLVKFRNGDITLVDVSTISTLAARSQ